MVCLQQCLTSLTNKLATAGFAAATAALQQNECYAHLPTMLCAAAACLLAFSCLQAS
jgi:hypothetical protein